MSIMKEKGDFTLTGIQGTLLVPLWGRAFETKKKKPLLVDEKAVEIINSITYDLSKIEKIFTNTAHMGFIARCIYFDGEIRKFINIHPEATIVNIGCGLDTTFDRIDNGKIQWIELDLPEVIDFRRKYIPESDRHLFIAKSVFDNSWYSSIKNKDEVMFLIAGVLQYFTNQEISNLFTEFKKNCPGVDVIFDYCSQIGMKEMNKSLIKTNELIKTARLQWCLDDIAEMKQINDRISVINNMTMYKEHKKNYPLHIRLLLSYFDFWKIASLAHVKVN
jgi:O-methyltransferase involved in polyketide biosynthesis